jgi:hypothetical protein
MATRTRKTGTGKTSSSKPRRTTRGSSTAAPAAPQLPGISAAERRKLAQEEARWRAESDLRTLDRRDPTGSRPAQAGRHHGRRRDEGPAGRARHQAQQVRLDHSQWR